ncbi:DUF4388 domain-containing protein [Allocoleopsis sp.]|uniref:DUF4388 domain-containing protein n=1 Tax=Allocoleopsis sp. TaxID=3088169 RepID=UPI002FD0FF5A
MSTTGFLSDFSLREIFQFIDQGHKTGMLSVRLLPEAQSTSPLSFYVTSYIWVYQGYIVAAAHKLDQQGLVSLIQQCQMVSDRVFDKLVHWCCPIDEPLGLYLKNQGVLKPEQLKQLFHVQVLQPISSLFRVKEGEFKFEPKKFIPTREMTGLSVPAIILNKYGLIHSLLEQVDNYCLNLESLPCLLKAEVRGQRAEGSHVLKMWD